MYKVTVLAYGESQFIGNGLTFETVEAAKSYGQDLFSRWSSVVFWRIEDRDGNIIFTTENHAAAKSAWN